MPVIIIPPSSPPASDSRFTQSPTAMGLVDVIPSILKIPLIRAMQKFPDSVFTVYQLPVDLYTLARMLWKFSEQGKPQYPFQYEEHNCQQHKRKKFLSIMRKARYFIF